MQSTADFHHHVAHPVFPHAHGLFQHATTFDTAIDMFDAYPTPRDLPVIRLLLWRQRLAAWLLRRLEELHALQRASLQPQILQELTPRWQWIRGRISQTLVMDAARSGLTQEDDAQRGIDQQQIFQHMPLCLAAITRLLFSRVCGARDGSLGAIMTKRGTAAGADGIGSPPSPSRWWRRLSRLRHGASPKVRKVFRNTGSKT